MSKKYKKTNMPKKNIPKKSPYEIKENVKNFTKNRLPAFILAGLMIFWTIASILGCVASCRTSKKTASAQSITELEDGYIIIDLPLFDGLTFLNVDSTNLINTSVLSLVFPSSTITGEVESFIYLHTADEETAVSFDLNINDSNYYGMSFYDFSDGLTAINDLRCVWNLNGSTCTPADNLYLDWRDIYLDWELYYNDTATAFVVDCDITLYRDIYAGAPTFNVISTEEEAISLSFYISLYDINTDSRFINTAHMFNSLPFGESLDVTTKGYGFATGNYLDLNYRYELMYNAYDNAFQEGVAIGLTNGYNSGYQAGLNDSDKYTFGNLLSAVFDVPIRTFTSLFNFDILGVNMANFFLSLLTVCVLICVIRWLL